MLHYLAGKIIQGLSSDTKPTGNTEVNTVFFETDTFKLFQYDGAVWTQQELSEQILNNKTLDAEQNTFIGTLLTAFAKDYKRVGIMTPAVTSDGSLYGALGGLQQIGDPSFGIAYNDALEGNVIQYRASSGGFGLVSATGYELITRRAYNPRLKIKMKIGDTTGKLFIGFSSAIPLPLTNSVLGVGDSGFIVGYISGTAYYTVYNNDGAGSMVSTSINVPTDTAWHTFEIIMSTANIVAILDDDTTVTATTKIPALNTNLYVYIESVA